MSACVLLLYRLRCSIAPDINIDISAARKETGDALLALRSAAEVWKDRAWMAGLGAAASLTACRIDRLNMVCVRVWYETRNVVLLMKPDEAID